MRLWLALTDAWPPSTITLPVCTALAALATLANCTKATTSPLLSQWMCVDFTAPKLINNRRVMHRHTSHGQACTCGQTHAVLSALVRVSGGQSAGKFETHTRPGTKLQLPADAERAMSSDAWLRGVPSVPPLLDESSAEKRRARVESKGVFLKYPGS